MTQVNNLGFSELKKTSIIGKRAESSSCCASGTCDNLMKNAVQGDEVVVGKNSRVCA